MFKNEVLEEFKTVKKTKNIRDRYKSAPIPAHTFFKHLQLEGNGVYLLIPIAKKLCIELGFDFNLIRDEMRSCDVADVVSVFDKYFTGYVSEWSFVHPNKF